MDPVRLSKERLEKIRKRIERMWVVSWTDARALLTEIVALQAEQAAAVQQIVALQVERAQATETIEALTVGLDLHRRRAAQRAAESTQLRIALDEMNDQLSPLKKAKVDRNRRLTRVLAGRSIDLPKN